MTRTALLFVDLLGTRARWHAQGRSGAEAAFHRFRELIEASLQRADAGVVRDGWIETDAAAIVCDTPCTAMRLGRNIYHDAFTGATNASQERLWLRGAIAPSQPDHDLKWIEHLPEPLSEVKVHAYSGELLDAVAVEKAGFRGMRLLIAEELISEGVKRQARIPINDRFLIPLKRLTNSVYPGRLRKGFQDYLWMACEGQKEWDSIKRLMASRLRWAAKESGEFLQAAATQVVFHECNAIIASLRRRPAGGRS